MTDKEQVSRLVAAKKDMAKKLAIDIWNYAELSYKEEKSSREIIDILIKEGFSVEEGIAGIPTAFLAKATVGSGKPVMGFLAEYDALDGLSQKAGETERCPVDGMHTGHGCGHNLLGAGTVLSAITTKEYLEQNGKNGTVALFGCPAEEGAGSKQFIARDGWFDNVDYFYTWHPQYLNTVSGMGSVAIMGANFCFSGTSSHAGAAPELGRSALDAVELMNVGCNYLREHIIDQARIHYAYSDAGGTAPNVVPDHATIKYEVRAPKVSQIQELFARVVNVARGAAIMTDTEMKYEITMAFSDYVANRTLAPIMDQALAEYGAPEWSDEDYETALKFLRTYPKTALQNIKDEMRSIFPDEDVESLLAKPLHSGVVRYDRRENRYKSGSTDIGDAGYVTPTVTAYIATSCFGNAGHSWQNTAFSASEIGMKGMLRAAEVMTLASVRTADMPELIEKAKKEVLEKNGGKYSCPLPDYTKPPIDTY